MVPLDGRPPTGSVLLALSVVFFCLLTGIGAAIARVDILANEVARTEQVKARLAEGVMDDFAAEADRIAARRERIQAHPEVFPHGTHHRSDTGLWAHPPPAADGIAAAIVLDQRADLAECVPGEAHIDTNLVVVRRAGSISNERWSNAALPPSHQACLRDLLVPELPARDGRFIFQLHFPMVTP